MENESHKQQSPELIEGIDYQVVNGRWLFTRAFLINRGYCCESGCRHCPYGFQERDKEAPGRE